MQKVISKEVMRQSDKYTIENKYSSLQLMNKAAEAVLKSYQFNGKVLIVAGTGNNAGDGYALALHLQKNLIDVNILLTENKFSIDGKYYYDKCKNNNIDIYMYNKEFNFLHNLFY